MTRGTSLRAVRCQISDYYRSGIDIELAQRFLDALEEEKYTLPDVKPWRLLELRKNLWSLGFLEARDEPKAYVVSSRGHSLLVAWRIAKRRLCERKTSQRLARYVLLKAIADIDWECFMSFLVARFQKKMKPSEIHTMLFPEDSHNNFSHRFGFHDSVAIQTSVSRLFQREELSPADLNPYSEDFRASEFFGTTVSHPPTSFVERALEKSLALFKDGIVGTSPLASTEALKTLVQTVLLSSGYFSAEPVLSSLLLELLIEQHVPVYQVSSYFRQGGRGLYRNRKFYTRFSVPRHE